MPQPTLSADACGSHGQRHLTLAALLVVLAIVPGLAKAQVALGQQRITQPINETQLVTLRGNTHPLAQQQYDRGAAPPDLPMSRMLLVLKRSADQEAALEKLLDDQQNPSSTNYHKWLTPDQFGQQFGPSDQDVQAVTSWLLSHGFQVAVPSRGRTVIEFSGTAREVQQAFRSEIHKFTVNGEDHWANASDPQIPSALAIAVEGIASLHNFKKQPMHRIVGAFSRTTATGEVQVLRSEYTFPNSKCAISGYCYFVGPYDFATIYNVLPLWNTNPAIDGTGQSIAILNESNINVQDIRDFRSLFGLPPNDPQIILNGADPGLVTGVETEADLDVEWSGAVAKGATIKLVVTAPSNATAGVDLSAIYAVENNVAGVISESFGDCELFLGNAGNAFENAIRQQAAAQGITFINSSGDEGSARCDVFGGSFPDPATHGLAVSGLASSPYGVAVGGTDFQNFGANNNFGVPSPHWSLTNNQNQASALGYIPETTWNGTCTNAVFLTLGIGANAESACSSSKAVNFVSTLGGGGGKSACTISDGANPASCTGGYVKPMWQSAPGVPADGSRDIPDVSLFASSGFMDSAYIVCEADQTNGVPCALNSSSTFLAVGGTSVAAPAFAGIVALVNQFTQATGQGDANYVLYALASSPVQTTPNCSAGSANPSCIFHDVTSGTNAVPCANGSPNCSVINQGDAYGVLPGYNAGPGYDLATGLGSVNAYNLVHGWTMPTNPSSITLSLTPTTLTHGQSVSYFVSVSPSTATGDVSLIGLPAGNGSKGMDRFTLQNGTASGTMTSLVGGANYQVYAHYAGDLTHAPSDSAPVLVTVNPEPSKPVIWMGEPFSPFVPANLVPSNPSSVHYGTAVAGFAGVGNAQATAAIPLQPVCAPLSCPTGTVTISDSLNGGALTFLSSPTGFPLNSAGISQDFYFIPLGGQHLISADYSGDSSYLAGSGSYTLTVTPVQTMLYVPNPIEWVLGGPNTLSVSVTGVAYPAAAPTGTITFADGTAPVPGTVTYSSAGQSLSGTIPYAFTTPGSHTISVAYSGDGNYLPSSTTMSGRVLYPTTIAVSVSPPTINAGDSATVTATATSSYKSPPMGGTFQFGGNAFSGCFSCWVSGSLSTDANGNQVLTASALFTPTSVGSGQSVGTTYMGDYIFNGGQATAFMNVNPPPFTLAASTPSLTITAGQSGSANLTVTPQTNFPNIVAFSCDTTKIAGASCSFNPTPPFNISGAAVSTSVTISTHAPSAGPTSTLVGFRPKRFPAPPAGWLVGIAAALATLSSLIFAGKRRLLAARIGFVGVLCLAAGCGGGSSGGANQPLTGLTLNTSSVKVAAGTNVTFTVAVSPPGSSGTIFLLDSQAVIASSPEVNGTASFSLGNLVVGTHAIQAMYQYSRSGQISQNYTDPLYQLITGTGPLTINATSSTISHATTIALTIQ